MHDICHGILITIHVLYPKQIAYAYIWSIFSSFSTLLVKKFSHARKVSDQSYGCGGWSVPTQCNQPAPFTLNTYLRSLKTQTI